MKKCYCNYCNKIGFPVLWKLEKNLFWYEIPKNASWSIKQKYKKRKIANHDSITDQDKILIIWRNPLERFESLFKHYFLNEGGRFILTKKIIKNVENLTLNERKKILIRNLNNFDKEMEIHHFYPQTRFIDTSFSSNFKLIKLENLSNEIKIQKSNHTITKEVIKFDDEEIKFIKNLYKDDYDFQIKFFR